MAEHLLNDLDVGACLDREAGGGVPQLVRCEAGQPGSLSCGIEEPRPEVGVPECAALRRGEHRFVGSLARQVRAEFLGQESRDGDRAALVVLCGPDDDLAADLGMRLVDFEPTTVQVNGVYSECRRLAPAQTAVGEDPYQGLVGRARLGEGGDLGVAEVALRSA
jgi:hypothetical protein